MLKISFAAPTPSEAQAPQPAAEAALDASSPTSSTPIEVKKKKKMPALPGGGMKREKTVVEKAADISDTKKKEMITMMMREQTTMALKINKEQHRQEELVSAMFS